MLTTIHSLSIFSLTLVVLISLLQHSVYARTHSLPSDAQALLDFKSKADLKNNLPYSKNTTLHYCKWPGVTCNQGKVVHLIVENLVLSGTFANDTLSRLDQLRVLSLQNNSLTGPIPDLSGLINLKTLFLDHNSFTGTFPASVISLHRIRTLDISYNNFTGLLPAWLAMLDRLIYLKLEWNQFNGSVPALNQTSLKIFNVSCNNLTGAIPVTQALSHFGASSFSLNPGLCGEIIHTVCHPRPPFFSPFPPSAAPPGHGQSAEVHSNNGMDISTPSCEKKHKRADVIIGFSAGVFFLVCSSVCFVMAVKKHRSQKGTASFMDADITAAAAVAEQESELEEKVKRAQCMQVAKSGNLVFCAGEPMLYTLDQLMRASAEFLGRGTMGTTYKAVLDNRLIVTVKRLDASKLGSATKEVFEQHMEIVGRLRHPNLVPLRAYFQSKEERIIVYDYQPNGSLFSLVHGSKSARAKPLHWTSCLKIAEDVAQGLSYIHQALRLVHGNLKSSNVLLGPDFEACITDYSLSVIGNSSNDDDTDSAAYKAPETRILNGRATPKSDVYAFGVLLMELLTGKPPSQHPSRVPNDLMQWMKSIREDGHGEDDKLRMLFEVAVTCSLTSPEQRPTMWQVLKMIQEIKETVSMEDTESAEPFNGL